MIEQATSDDERARQPEMESSPSTGSPSVRQAAIRGLLWNTFGRVLDRGLELIRIFVLARLLTPKEFGLFAIVLLYSSAIQSLTFTGFREALVRRTGDPRPLYDTAFVVEPARGLALGLLFALAAPIVSWIYGEPALLGLLLVFSLQFVLLGATNVGIVELDRDLQFGRNVAMVRAASILSFVVGIATAYWLRSAWAFVIAEIARSIALVALSYGFSDYRPKLRFEPRYFWELFGFGSWLLVNSVSVFILTNVDGFLIAGLIGPAVLAVYQMAQKMALFPANTLIDILRKLTYPLYSRIHADHDRLARAFGQVLAACLAIVVPGSLAVACFSEEIRLVALPDPAWQEVGPLAAILAFLGLAQIVVATTEPVFDALGVPKINTLSRYMHLFAFIPIVAILTKRYGAVGAAFGVTVAAAAPLVVQLVAMLRRFPNLASTIGLVSIGVGTASAAMLGCVVSLRLALGRQLGWTTILEVICSAIAYLVVMALADQVLRLGLWRQMQPILASAIRRLRPAS